MAAHHQPHVPPRPQRAAVLVMLAVTIAASGEAATIYKKNNTTRFTTGSSWVGGKVPGSSDTAVFDSRFTYGGTGIGTGGAVTWGGLRILNPNGKVVVNNTVASSYLGIASGGIDMASASRNLSIESLKQFANHTWNVASGRTLFVGNTFFDQGNYAVSLAGAGTVTFQRSSLTLGNSSSFSGTLSAGSAAVTLSAGSGSSSSIGGSLVTAGALTKTGAGIYTVSGSNTFGSGVTLAAGTLVLGSSNAIGTQGSLTFSGGTLRYTSANRSDYSSRFSSTNGQQYRLDTNGQSVALGSVIRSGNSLTKLGSGTLTLSATNTYTGSTTISAGTLNVTGRLGSGAYAATIANAGALVLNQALSQTLSGVVSGAGALTKAGNGTLTLSATNTYSGATTISGGTLQVTGRLGSGTYAGNIANGSAVVFSQTSDQTLSGVVSGSGSLTKSGSGNLALSGTNTYSGTTTVSGGTLTITGRLGSGTYAGNITNDSALVFNQSSNQTLSGALSGNGSLMKQGSGQLTLSGNNKDFSGDVTVNGGVLVLDHDTALSDSVALTLTSGATLTVNAGHTVSVDVFTLEAGRINGSGVLEAATTEVDSATIETPIRDAPGKKSGFVKRGTGTTTIQSANTFTGTLDIRSGTVRLGTGGSFASAATLTMETGATLDLADKSQAFASISGSDGAISLGAGTLSISGAGTFGGGISGTGNFSKTGDGNLILTGSNAYEGSTTVSGGRLSINGSLGNTAVSVSGGELGGNGSVSGDIAILAGATLAPGNSIESLASGSTSFTAGATFAYEVDSSDLEHLELAADLLVVNGNLTIDSGSLLAFTDLGTQPGEFIMDTTVFAMIQYTGSWNGGTFTFAGQEVADGGRFQADGQTWEIDYDSPTGGVNFTSDYETGGSFVTVTAVPEPSTWILCCIAGSLAVITRCRLRRSPEANAEPR